MVAYYFNNLLQESLWIFYLLPYFILGTGFIGLFIISIIKKNKVGIALGGVFLTAIGTIFLLNSELFKSKKVLEATLMDDLSAIHLTLRENQKFEVNASTLFTEDNFIGKYQLEGDKIIFLDKQYSNDFIPDTVTIVGDKIILKFDNGKPVLDFATYFNIKKNEIKTTPQQHL